MQFWGSLPFSGGIFENKKKVVGCGQKAENGWFLAADRHCCRLDRWPVPSSLGRDGHEANCRCKARSGRVVMFDRSFLTIVALSFFGCHWQWISSSQYYHRPGFSKQSRAKWEPVIWHDTLTAPALPCFLDGIDIYVIRSLRWVYLKMKSYHDSGCRSFPSFWPKRRKVQGKAAKPFVCVHCCSLDKTLIGQV